MPVQEQTTYTEHVGNGVTTTFAYQFKVLELQDLEVQVDGVIQVGNYSVTGLGVDAGGTVVFDVAPANLAAILLISEVVLERATDYQEDGDLQSGTLDDDFDRLWLAAQGGKAKISSAIRVPVPEQVPPLPKAASRKDRLLAFDATTGAPELSEFTATQVANAVAAAYGTGSTLDALTFIQAGADAVPRTAQDKMRENVSVSVKDYGAKGDGVTDDSDAINAALQYAANVGGEVLFPPGTYLHNSPLVAQTNIQLDPPLTGGQFHFTDARTITIRGSGRPTLLAGAAMSEQLRFTFNEDLTDVAPMYCTVTGMHFDGANLAGKNLYVEWSLHAHISRNSFVDAITGIYNYGYGVAQYLYNVFYCTTGIDVARGGDSYILHNDFVMVTDGVGINMGPFSGNTNISGNIFSKEEATGEEIGIRLSGDASVTGAEEVRDLVIQNNEFSGTKHGVFARAHASVDNIYNIIIRDNHVRHFAASVNAALAYLEGCVDVIIESNNIGSFAYPTLHVPAIEMQRCERITIRGNKLSNLQETPIVITNSSRCVIDGNEFLDVAKISTGASIIFATDVTNCLVRNNKLHQSSGTYGASFFRETTGCDFNSAYRNVTNVITPYIKTGASSRLVREEWQAAPDTTTFFNLGDVIHNTAPTTIKNISHWVCRAAGQPASFSAYGCGTGTTAQRPALGNADFGYLYRDATTGLLIMWDGGAWVPT
jgi:hypothetical protein